MGEANLAGRDVPFPPSEGLKWAAPKSDRLKITSGAVTVRYLVNESAQAAAPRARIHPCQALRAHRRAPGAGAGRPKEKIPPFNPLEPLRDTDGNPGEDNEFDATRKRQRIVNVIELLGGILPDEDGQELEDAEIAAARR